MFIGLDIGTTAVKGVLISEDGSILAQAKRLTQFIKPAPGYFEIDPENHYRSVCEVIRELTASVPHGKNVKALSMASASGNTLLLDKNNQPLTNLISWMDQRAVGLQEELFPSFDFSTLHDTVGWFWVEMFPLAHLGWLKKKQPHVYKKATRVSMFIDYLYYRLCGNWLIDQSNATTSYLQDQKKGTWHKPYLEYLEIDDSYLSEIKPSGFRAGKITPQAALDTGLHRDTELALGAFDHPCAARGTGNLDEGNLMLSCGTSWVGVYPTKDRDLALRNNLLIDPFLTPAGPWATFFSHPAIGVNIDWYIDNIIAKDTHHTHTDKYTLFNQAAQESSPGAEGVIIDPFKDPSQDKAYSSHIRKEKKENIARALMEGAAFEMKKKIEALHTQGFTAQKITMVGGPSESPIWPQILSTITGLQLRLINGQVAGAFGSTLLAAIGLGFFRNEREAFDSIGGTPSMITPQKELQERYQEVFTQYNDKTRF
jgi:sugar (pentulose or hexulose) kinase